MQTESNLNPRIKNRIATSPVVSKAQEVALLPDVCKIKKPQYNPVIAFNSSSEEIQPFVLSYTAKRLVCKITVYVLDPPNSGPKSDKSLVTLDLMNKYENSKNLSPFYLYKPDILANLKDSAHQYIMFLDEFFQHGVRVQS